VSVATINFVLVKTNDFSIWYGRGFGMFASLDGPATRYLIVTYTDNVGIMKVNLDDYETETIRIKTHPSDKRIQKLLQKLCQTRPMRVDRLFSTLYKLSYDPTAQTVAPVLWKELTIDC
jgi:hypothetical protein